MFLDRRFILVTFVVFTGLQNTVTVGFPDECQRGLGYCTIRVSLPYIGLKSDEALAKARATPLAKHCADWGTAIVCNRHQLRSEECQNVTSADTKKIIKYVEAVDLIVNYACKENFQKFSKIYQCLLDRAVYRSTNDKCKDLKFNATNVCEKKPELIECSAEGVAAQCGSEAGSVTTELGPKLLEIMIEATYDRKCSPSKRDDFTDLMKRFFYRK